MENQITDKEITYKEITDKIDDKKIHSYCIDDNCTIIIPTYYKNFRTTVGTYTDLDTNLDIDSNKLQFIDSSNKKYGYHIKCIFLCQYKYQIQYIYHLEKIQYYPRDGNHLSI